LSVFFHLFHQLKPDLEPPIFVVAKGFGQGAISTIPIGSGVEHINDEWFKRRRNLRDVVGLIKVEVGNSSISKYKKKN
jgi:hypothetical protein